MSSYWALVWAVCLVGGFLGGMALYRRRHR
jgi:hypothetical protein